MFSKEYKNREEFTNTYIMKLLNIKGNYLNPLLIVVQLSGNNMYQTNKSIVMKL